jgi:hypothetical protein
MRGLQGSWTYGALRRGSCEHKSGGTSELLVTRENVGIGGWGLSRGKILKLDLKILEIGCAGIDYP